MADVLIVAIGNELLNGKTLDYNSHWISKRMSSLGLRVKRVVVVPDIEEEIIDVLNWGKEKRVNLIITTGGLGPTPGDITLECISKFLGERMVLDDRALKMVEKRYRELYELGFVKSLELNEPRKKMALVPENCDVIYNDVGVAPGVLCRRKGLVILALPGVPSEMMYLLEKSIPLIVGEVRKGKFVREFRVECGDESLMANILKAAMEEFKNITIKTYPEGFGDKVYMRVIVEIEDLEKGGKQEELFYEVREFIEKKAKEINC